MKRLFVLSVLLFLLLGVQAQRTYVLVCGVSQYDDPSGACVNLKYPAKGAKMMKNVYEKAGFITSILTSQYVTEDNVVNRLNDIVKIAKPEDNIIFQFIGHGSTGRIHFYRGTPFAYLNLIELLSKARTKNVFCFIDACQSGSAITTIKDYNEDIKGAKPAFLMACRANESTLETALIASPAFTMALSKGLRGRADMNSDKQVTLMELFRYIHSDVTSRGKALKVELHPQLLGNSQLFDTVINNLK